MERREEILQAAARVYAMHGYRGSTTRRIADEAGVNEITIFRQFGTKDALIHEAIAGCASGEHSAPLPQIPLDPYQELLRWATVLRSNVNARRALMRRCMSERDEHPQLIASANRGPLKAATELRNYLERLRDHGLADESLDARAASAMYLGTLFSDAMGRDTMPDIYPSSVPHAVEAYTTLLLRAIGADAPRVTAEPAHLGTSS
jgi:AcrR family transcriptional regulator